MIPQLIYIALAIFGLSLHAIKNGERRTDKYTFWGQLVALIISITILYYGGFWNPILPLLN